LRQLKPYGFAHTAAEAVADNGFAQGARGCETDAGAGTKKTGDTECREKGTRLAFALVVDLAEIAGSQEPYTFGEFRSFSGSAGSSDICSQDTRLCREGANVRDPTTSRS
jgi:hypothetical protein